MDRENKETLQAYRDYLVSEEKSAATQEKYLHIVKEFCSYLQEQPVTKQLVLAYKQTLLDAGYADRSVNGFLLGSTASCTS